MSDDKKQPADGAPKPKLSERIENAAKMRTEVQRSRQDAATEDRSAPPRA